MPENTNAITTTENTNNYAMQAQQQGFVTTVDTSTFEGAMAVANAVNASESLNKYAGKDDMLVVDILIAPGNRQQTGEPCLNVHLVLADNTTLFSQSTGIARSAKTFLELPAFIDAMHNGGIRMRVKEQQLNNGNTMKSLEILPKK